MLTDVPEGHSHKKAFYRQNIIGQAFAWKWQNTQIGGYSRSFLRLLEITPNNCKTSLLVSCFVLFLSKQNMFLNFTWFLLTECVSEMLGSPCWGESINLQVCCRRCTDSKDVFWQTRDKHHLIQKQILILRAKSLPAPIHKYLHFVAVVSVHKINCIHGSSLFKGSLMYQCKGCLVCLI